MTDSHSPTIDDVRRAAQRIGARAWHTPIVRSSWLSDRCGADVWLKLESVQTTGSFKIRGALNALLARREAGTLGRCVVTASAGNHGQAVAWAARELGIPARVHLPATAPAVKRHAIAALGAEIVEAPSYDEAEARAHADAMTTGSPYLSPYNDADVIAGAGTVALEMIADHPELEAIVVPLGGGGLLAGIGIVARAAERRRVVIGAEAEASPVFTASLAAGEVTTVDVAPTLADGLAGNLEPGSATFAIVRDVAHGVALVAESSIALAMRELIRRDRLVVEGASATAVGALLQGGLELRGRCVGVVLSGRNVDAATLDRVLGGG